MWYISVVLVVVVCELWSWLALPAVGNGHKFSSCYSTLNATATLKFIVLNFSFHEFCISVSATAESCTVVCGMVRFTQSIFHSQDTNTLIHIQMNCTADMWLLIRRYLYPFLQCYWFVQLSYIFPTNFTTSEHVWAIHVAAMPWQGQYVCVV